MDYEEQGRKFDFWDGRSAWPIETKDYTFLATAVRLVGKSLFPDDWTGEEPAEFYLPVLPAPGGLDHGTFLSVFAANILARYRPDVEVDRDSFILSAEAWIAAIDAFQQHEAAHRSASAARMLTVTRQMIGFLADGKLQSFHRPVDGAAVFTAIKADLWTENAAPRFAYCRFNPRAPFIQVPTPDDEYIFISRPRLERLERVLSGRPKAGRVAHERPITAAEQETLINLMEAIRSDPRNAPSEQPIMAPPKRKRKREPQDQVRVRPVVAKLYPEGVPDKSVLTDGQLVKAVADAMSNAPSRETILRAAGRL